MRGLEAGPRQWDSLGTRRHGFGSSVTSRVNSGTDGALLVRGRVFSAREECSKW